MTLGSLKEIKDWTVVLSSLYKIRLRSDLGSRLKSALG